MSTLLAEFDVTRKQALWLIMQFVEILLRFSEHSWNSWCRLYLLCIPSCATACTANCMQNVALTVVDII